jgi:hypothetical protein
MTMRTLSLALALLFVCACRSTEFDPGSKLESVRILGLSADTPYAKPGDAVNLQVLALDARASKATPMRVWWLPDICENPQNDASYACYPALERRFQANVDLTPQLTEATSFSFQMPSDAIAAHHTERGGAPYGLVVAFVVACAGHVEYVPKAVGAPVDALPLGCFDDQHTQLGPEQFVFGYSLVYAFADRTNANPELAGLAFDGNAVDPTLGISVDHCTRENIDDCPTTPLSVSVPASSQELDASNLDAKGNSLREEIWVDYYLTAGKVKHDTLILYDPRDGMLSDTHDDFRAPQVPGAYRLWAVVHDNRGGTSWTDVPLTAR